MNLLKKRLDFNIGDKGYVMMFDMKSIAVYKQLTGKSFSKAIGKLFEEDDEETLNFIASTLRAKENEDEPLGNEVINGDTLFYLLNFKFKVVELVALSLPTGENNSKKK